MTSLGIAKTMPDRYAGRSRYWFAASPGVGPERKEEINLEMYRSASLRDSAYWLQVLFVQLDEAAQ